MNQDYVLIKREVLQALVDPTYRFGDYLVVIAQIKELLAAPCEPVPLESSEIAATEIKKMMAEYNYPSNPYNAARAGWRACRLYAPKDQDDIQTA